MSGINYDLTKIRGFAFDVDGVLSPSVIPMSENGEPLRMANIKDGYALQLAAKLGYKLAIITGGNTIAVKNRYEALGFKDIFLKASHKLEIFLKWMEDNGLETDEVIYFGDDIPDLKCMRIAGLPAHHAMPHGKRGKLHYMYPKFDGAMVAFAMWWNKCSKQRANGSLTPMLSVGNIRVC